MPRSPGMRPLCHPSWAVPPPPTCRWYMEGRRGEGHGGGHWGWAGTAPHLSTGICVWGEGHTQVWQRDQQSVPPGPILPNPPATLGPVHPQAGPVPPSAVPPPPSCQRPSATSGTHSPLNILRGGSGATPAPLHSAWTWDLAGTVTSGDSSAENRGSEGRDSRGANPNPREGRCAPSGTSRLYAEGLEELETRTLPGCCATVKQCSHFGKVWQFFKP